jgi:hypothetical protein
MIPRLIIIVLLALGILAQALAMVSTLQDDPLLKTKQTANKKSGKQPVAKGKMSAFYPRPPARLPDLNEGYIFNAQRSLAGTGNIGKEQRLQQVDINNVQYSGSLITGTTTKALLSYTLKSTPSRRTPRTGTQKQGHLQVTVGDTVDGYKITKIFPEKIVFSKGNDKIEKHLYDQNKKRVAPKQPVKPKPTITKKRPPAIPRPPGIPPGMPQPHQMERHPPGNNAMPPPIPMR